MNRPHEQILSDLLRAPAQMAARCLNSEDLRDLAQVAIAATTFAGAAFGATVGGHRGGIQIFYSALKVPAALLLTLVLCVPAYYAIANHFGRPWPLRRVIALALASIARAALVLLATVPALWFLIDIGASYHTTALWAAIAQGLSGLAALGILYRALGPAPKRLLILSLMVGVFACVGGQVAWSLRPYLGRPSQDEVPFLRAPDGLFIERVWTSGRSSMGDYDTDAHSNQPEDAS